LNRGELVEQLLSLVSHHLLVRQLHDHLQGLD
jgi:hypothetical protein